MGGRDKTESWADMLRGYGIGFTSCGLDPSHPSQEVDCSGQAITGCGDEVTRRRFDARAINAHLAKRMGNVVGDLGTIQRFKIKSDGNA